jgi:hypothetical protein
VLRRGARGGAEARVRFGKEHHLVGAGLVSRLERRRGGVSRKRGAGGTD